MDALRALIFSTQCPKKVWMETGFLNERAEAMKGADARNTHIILHLKHCLGHPIQHTNGKLVFG